MSVYLIILKSNCWLFINCNSKLLVTPFYDNNCFERDTKMMVWSFQLEITVCCFCMKFTDWVNCVRITNF